MNGVIRGKDALVGSQGVEIGPSLNPHGQLISVPWIYNLMLQGRIYTGGYGIEATHPDGEADLDDTNPTVMLRAPDQGVVVIPLYVRLRITTEGGAAPTGYLTQISTGTNSPIAYTSGTNIQVLNALGGARRGPSARFEHTVTIGAVADAQNNQIWEADDLLDNLQTVEMVTTKNIDTVDGRITAVTIPFYPHIPIGLCRGDMLNFYAETGTTDSKWLPYFVWAEVDETVVPAS